MPGTVRFQLGALVVATDGLCGVVKGLSVDPSVPRVVHLEVEPEHRIGLGRLVPVELVCQVEHDAGDGIDLDCDLAAFEALPSAETSEVVEGAQVAYVPFYLRSAPPPLRLEVHESVPKGETGLQSGVPVSGTDGEIGKLAGFDVELPRCRVARVLVNEARFPWGHRTVALPKTCVVGFGNGVEVNLTVEEAAKVASAQGS
jgi:hypothetical protein